MCSNPHACGGGTEPCCAAECSAYDGDRVLSRRALKLVNTGGPVLRYEFDKGLPQGLHFDNFSGTFWGAAAEVPLGRCLRLPPPLRSVSYPCAPAPLDVYTPYPCTPAPVRP